MSKTQVSRNQAEPSRLRLQGKVAVVTGAGSGIGRATALLFAREGAKVVVADVQDDAARGTVGVIKQSRGEAVFVHADVSRAQDVAGMIKTAVELWKTRRAVQQRGNRGRNGEHSRLP